MIGVARVYQDRMQLGSIRSSVLIAAAPGFAHRMLVESGNAIPGFTAVFRSKKTLG
jgi:hypothetical protein